MKKKYRAESKEDGISTSPGWEHGHSVRLHKNAVGSRVNVGEAGDDFLPDISYLDRSQGTVYKGQYTGNGPRPMMINGALIRVIELAMGWRAWDLLAS